MKYTVSPNVAVRTPDKNRAAAFYQSVIGLTDRSSDPDLADFEAGPINLFVIDDDEISGPVLELFVDDLEAARDHLLANGCSVLRWRGKGQDCYIQDPFGVIFNVWEMSAE
jgi:predicted enzyme related to lactoylglutathione lyase